MKKVAIALVLAVLVTGVAFADFSMSAGGGLLLDMSYGNGLEGDIDVSFDNTSFGAFVFFDLTYIEASLYYSYGIVKSEISGGGQSMQLMPDMNLSQFGFTLLGKIPIELGGFVLFPAFGIGYNSVLSATDEDGATYSDAADLSQFGLLLGAGADFPLGDGLFLRAEALCNIRLPSKVMVDLLDYLKPLADKTTVGLGPCIKVGMGFKL